MHGAGRCGTSHQNLARGDNRGRHAGVGGGGGQSWKAHPHRHGVDWDRRGFWDMCMACCCYLVSTTACSNDNRWVVCMHCHASSQEVAVFAATACYNEHAVCIHRMDSLLTVLAISPTFRVLCERAPGQGTEF